jgi:hypothetical protein
MTRPLRFLMKKRGDRRTGAPGYAILGAILIYGAALVTGIAMLGYLLWSIVLPEWHVNQTYQETIARVTAKHLGEQTTEQAIHYRPEVTIRYEVSGKTLETTTYDVLRWYSLSHTEQQELLDQFTVGETYPVWYDPAQPERAVLVREISWWLWLALLIPVALILFGTLRMTNELLRRNSSPERLTQKRLLVTDSSTTEVIAGQPGVEYPTLPRDDNITNSPGTHLAYRLPINISSWVMLAAVFGVTLFWNATWIVFAVVCIRDWTQGNGSWFLTLFLVPFSLAGLVMVGLLVRAAIITLGVGPTQVEISKHPWRAGGEYEVWFSQSGKLTLKHFSVELVCEESVTYRQGTDTRTERCIVHRQTLFERRDFVIPEATPLAEQVVCRLPATAMHSFEAPSNEIQWKIMVRAEIVSWPNFERSFSIVVQPAEPVAWIPHA